VPGVAAGITVLVAAIILFVPTGLVGTQVFKEVSIMYQRVSEAQRTEHDPLPTLIQGGGPLVEKVRERLSSTLLYALDNIDKGAREAFGWALSNAGDFSRQLAEFGVKTFIWLFAFYYLLRDGGRVRKMLISLSPLSDKYDKELADRIILSVKSVVGGSLIVALCQGAAAGVGMWFLGVPTPVLWGSVAVITSLIPAVGTGLVLLPAAAYLFLFSSTWSAVGLAIWALTIVNLIDNILRPKLIERDTKVHPLLILLSVLGGLVFMGPVGFLIGPIVVSILAEFLEIYNKMVLHHRNEVLTANDNVS
jgi:predicted PurR-regulated permease PerM